MIKKPKWTREYTSKNKVTWVPLLEFNKWFRECVAPVNHVLLNKPDPRLEKFAAMAMQGICSNEDKPQYDHDSVAKWSVAYAKALCKALDEEQKNDI